MPQVTAQKRPLRDTAEWLQLRCSFCGEGADRVRFLAAGVAGGVICDCCALKSLGIFFKAYLTRAFGTVRE